MKIKLNLIPEYKKEEIAQKTTFLRILRWNFEFAAVYFIFIAVLFAMGYILKLSLLTNAIQLSPNNISRFKEFKEYDTEIKEMNARVSIVKKIQGGQLNWSNFFVKLNESIGEGIAIKNIATKDYSVLLAGDSINRDSLITFKEKMMASDCFTDVNLPLSYLVPKDNLDFQISFNVKKECLKQIDGQ